MSTVFEMEYLVDSRDVDLFNTCRPSRVLGFLQEAATQAALALGASGPQVLEKYHTLWIVNHNWAELSVPLRWNDRLVIRTWHRGGNGVSTMRDFDIFRDGVQVGQAVSGWLMVDADTRKLFRMKDVSEFQGTDGGELNKSIKLHRVKMPEQFAHSMERYLGYSNTDINGHINNTHYMDYACDALHMEKLGEGRFVTQFQVDYISECMAGDTIRVDTLAQGDDLFAQGQRPDGEKCFDCTMKLKDL